MSLFLILYKRFSPVTEKFVLVEDVIDADGHRTNECGVLTFFNHDPNVPYDDHALMSIPPGMWMAVQQVEKAPEPEKSSLLTP